MTRLVVDTSAVIAILFGEPEREAFHRTLLANEPIMSVANVAEALMVAQGRRGARAMVEVDGFIADYRIEVAPVTAEDLATIHRGIRAYGKGRRAKPAALNFGDVFAYALAKRLGVPLLFKGDDFTHTDVTRAVSAAADA